MAVKFVMWHRSIVPYLQLSSLAQTTSFPLTKKTLTHPRHQNGAFYPFFAQPTALRSHMRALTPPVNPSQITTCQIHLLLWSLSCLSHSLQTNIIFFSLQNNSASMLLLRKEVAFVVEESYKEGSFSSSQNILLLRLSQVKLIGNVVWKLVYVCW